MQYSDRIIVFLLGRKKENGRESNSDRTTKCHMVMSDLYIICKPHLR